MIDTEIIRSDLDRALLSLEDIVINAKIYGAIGDGVADDTAAIQKALDTGKAVRLTRGTYLVTNSLKFSTNSVLIGDYENADDYTKATTKISFQPTTLKDLFVYKTQPAYQVYVPGIFIKGIAIEGENANCNALINMRNLYKPVFDNLSLYGGFKIGVVVDGWLGAETNRCTFSAVTDVNVKVVHTDFVTTTTTFTKCYFLYGNLGILALEASANAIDFNDCIFETLNSVADIYRTNYITMNDPHIENVPKSNTRGSYALLLGVHGNKTGEKIGSFVLNGGISIGCIPSYENTKFLSGDWISNIAISTCVITRASCLFDITPNVQNIAFTNIGTEGITYLSSTSNWDNVTITGCNFYSMLKNEAEISNYITGTAILPQICFSERTATNVKIGNMFLDTSDMKLKYKDKNANIKTFGHFISSSTSPALNDIRLLPGEIFYNTDIQLGKPIGWVNMRFSGAFELNTYNVCTTTAGSPVIYDPIEQFWGARIGDYVTVSTGMPSATVPYKIIAVDQSKKTITLNVKATSTTSKSTVYMPKYDLQPFGQQGYRSNDGTPKSKIAPYFIGEEILDYTNKVWYKSVGLINTDWKLMT